jgi:tetratricopeptide (TPR) repeat protein
MAGRNDDFLLYVAAAEEAVASGRFDPAPIELEATLGGGFLYSADAEQCIAWGHRLLLRWPEHRYWVLPHWVFAFTFAGEHDEALAASEELFEAVDGMANPALVTGALFAYGYTHRNRDPDAAQAALRRGLAIAQTSGLRQMESVLAATLSSVAANHGSPAEALEYLALAIRTYYDSGSLSFVTGPLGMLAVVLDRLERYEQAATVSTFAEAAIALATYPEIALAMAHIREVLGKDRYELFARVGAEMTHAARASYALDQIDRIRAELSNAGESP